VNTPTPWFFASAPRVPDEGWIARPKVTTRFVGSPARLLFATCTHASTLSSVSLPMSVFVRAHTVGSDAVPSAEAPGRADAPSSNRSQPPSGPTFTPWDSFVCQSFESFGSPKPTIFAQVEPPHDEFARL
jgi:hypothetical protein